MTPKPPITLAEIPDDWPALVRHAASVHEGVPLRKGAENCIEAWSVNWARWMAVMLPGGGTTFATVEDRDVVFGRIQNGAFPL